MNVSCCSEDDDGGECGAVGALLMTTIAASARPQLLLPSPRRILRQDQEKLSSVSLLRG